MTKYDANHPEGIELPPIQQPGIELAPVTVRQMTEEEREYYGEPVKWAPGCGLSAWPKKPTPKDWGEV